MATANDILNIARAEIGYKEDANNNNKYGAEYGMNYQPWCVMFIWWLFKQAGASVLFCDGNRTALCSTLYNYHKSKGQSVGTSSLRAGDIVFFDFTGRKSNTSHVGIVESVGGSSVVTIEGNTSSGSGGSQANGDGVYRRTRSKSLISCAYRPAYDGTMATVPDSRIDTVAEVQAWLNSTYSAGLAVDGIYGKNTRKALIRVLQSAIGVAVDGIVGRKTRAALPTLAIGARETAVCVAQALLVCYGYNSAYVDGDFGNGTKTAVKAFQSARRLSADGIIGKNTWTALLK